MLISVRSMSLMILVASGRSFVPGILRCRFSNAPQSSIHLVGARAAFSSSKLLMSDMGKLGRKRVFSRHTRWSAATQTARCRVIRWKALQVLIIRLPRFEQRKIVISTYLTQRHNIGRIETHADTDLHIQANVCERQRSHRHEILSSLKFGTGRRKKEGFDSNQVLA